MPPLVWSESYRVGHPQLDELHRQLIETLAELQQCLQGGDPRPLVLELMDAWLDRFAAHAQVEERLLEQLGLPGAIVHRDHHVAEHADFLHRLMLLRNAYARGSLAGDTLETLGMQLIADDMIRRDFEMIGLLLREGRALEP